MANPNPEVPLQAVQFNRTQRPSTNRLLTSFEAGTLVPCHVDHVLREESVTGAVTASIQMAETPELVTNAIHANMYTYFVPYLADEFAQFNGSLEELNRSYAKQPSISTGSVIPFFEVNKYWNGSAVVSGTASTFDTDTSHGRAEFYQTLGIHIAGNTVNSSYVQAYNASTNTIYKNRSEQLTLRNPFDHTLAKCLWPKSGNDMIVADYDEKLIAGEVTLNGLTFSAPLTSTRAEYNTSDMSTPTNTVDATASGYLYNPAADGANITNVAGKFIWSDIMAELTTSSTGAATLSLADFDKARKTARWAKLRSEFAGRTDDWIIDQLMQGHTMPLERLKEPILVGYSAGVFGMNQRYATGSASDLDDSRTLGIVQVSHRVSVPRTVTGGILITMISCAPEQIWERKKDYFLYNADTDNLPNALRDHLSIEGGQGVAAVTKDHLDVLHSSPTAVLGYAPINHEHRKNDVHIGGKFYRPASDTTYVQDRARLWSNEVQNPSLNTDHYLCTTLHKKVFADQVADGFEMSSVSALRMATNVQFGPMLKETDTSSDYDAITAIADG